MKDISKTLLIPLWCRYKDAISNKPVYNDKDSIEIIKNLKYDFSVFEQMPDYLKSPTIGDLVIRAEIIDESIKDIISQYNELNIINLGCGLDNRFKKFSQKIIHFYDVDLEEVINLKKQFYNENQNYTMISSDIFAINNYINTINKIPTIIIAEGIFMYYKKEQVFKLINELKNSFGKTYFIIETGGKLIELFPHPVFKKMGIDIKYNWGNFMEFAIKKNLDNIKISKKIHIFEYDYEWKHLNFLFALFPFIKNLIGSKILILESKGIYNE